MPARKPPAGGAAGGFNAVQKLLTKRGQQAAGSVSADCHPSESLRSARWVGTVERARLPWPIGAGWQLWNPIVKFGISASNS
jgi:hypothetical protein